MIRYSISPITLQDYLDKYKGMNPKVFKKVFGVSV